ncbi:BTAD domain-containing putative transcriptional regulator [Cyclobacterium salsum]|uniref:BTAD domain-containing putative transcriptional regulator n=1 Tax=Cyclobacterium salsum TaxID=2666329 RepID=UPI00139117CA|nr:BTAD domain-containing putative transcriptional regulator [Cyclobacterium salsum]
MTELKIFGPAEMRNSRGELEHSFLAGPKRLALLVYLLLHKPHGFHRRDSLLPVFWPDQDQKSARNSLSNMLYHIRKTLGTKVVENRGSEEIAINPEVFWCDAVAFEKAVREKDYETAFNLYRSDFLKGFHVQEASSEFDHWLEQERKRFHNLALEGGRLLAERAFGKRNYTEAVSWARKASGLDPFSEKVHLQLIKLLNEVGDPESALETYTAFTDHIKREFGEEPGQELKSLCQSIKERKPTPPIISSAENLLKESSPQPSIAVLPFESIGIDKASSFTAAIHCDILTRLSQVSDLFVISRTSVLNLGNTSKLLPEIARELQVDWVLTGEVQEIGKQVKVSVRLVNALNDRQVWAEIYQRELSAGEVFKIQSEITHNIITALEMRLSSKEKKAIKQIPTEDLEAFRLQAYGRWKLDQRTEKAMRMAEDYFRQAISYDPKYAQAWMGLADALTLLHDYGHEKDGKNILSEAQQAAQQALKLDPGMSEAYASLGLFYSTKRNAKPAVYNLKKAIELQPGHAEAHAWLSWIYSLTGNPVEALENALEAVKVNPLSQEAISNLSLSRLINGEYTKSLHEAERLQQIQPDFKSAQFQEGLALYHLGRDKEVNKVLKELVVPWAGNGPLTTRILSCIRSGELQEAEWLSEGIKNDQFAIGLIQAAHGEKDLALEKFLKIEFWDYWEMLSIHHLYPDLLDFVRRDAHFPIILQKVNKTWGLTHQKELPKIKIEANSKANSKYRKRQIGIDSE